MPEYECTIDAKQLKTLEGHPDLKPGLTSLEIVDGEMLEALDSLESLTDLRSLNLVGCDSLQTVDVLANLTQLTSLDLGHCNAREGNVSLLRPAVGEARAAARAGSQRWAIRASVPRSDLFTRTT